MMLILLAVTYGGTWERTTTLREETLPICQTRTRMALVAPPTCISARRPSVKRSVTYNNTRQTSTWPGTYRNSFIFRASSVIPRGGAISESILRTCEMHLDSIDRTVLSS